MGGGGVFWVSVELYWFLFWLEFVRMDKSDINKVVRVIDRVI